MIELIDIVKSFEEQAVFSDFSTTIESGKITSIYGPSGCGKTTLLNIIGLIEKPNEGTIIIDGETIKTEKQRRSYLRHRIGFVFQNFGLLEDETVYDNLSLLYCLRKTKPEAKKRIMKEALLKVGLQDILNKKIYKCSGGEQQRIAIAKLLIKNCDIILCDEPTASLDQDNKDVILSYLKQMRDEGKTVIVVTHDEGFRSVSDNFIELKRR